MPMTIMHQTAHDLVDASKHLEDEWRLFQTFEAGALGCRCMTWETTRPVVVVGRNNRPADHVVLEACLEDNVPVLQRCSGGGAVLLAPGCLNYAVAISLISHPDFAHVAYSVAVILGRTIDALDIPGLRIAGDADLALNTRKVSGSAQRRGRRALLHHGTLLYGFDARLADRYLREPARQPAYRDRRQHIDFIGNLPLSKDGLEARVLNAWDDANAPVGRRC